MGELENKPPKPDNYLVWAILTTILCCLPFGIVSIVYSSKVDKLFYNGQYDEAIAKSKSAKTWAIVAAICGIVYYSIVCILVFAGVFAGVAGGHY